MGAPKGNKFAIGKGRPTDYKPEFDEQVYKLSLLGATDKEIADFFNVTKQTINNWKNEYISFFDSIKRGKIIADTQVAESLHKRATGYDYEEVTTIAKNKGTEVYTEVHKTKKHVVPDTAAMNIWLKNRRGRVKDDEGLRWADKQEVDLSNTDGTLKQDLSNKTAEQLAEMAENVRLLEKAAKKKI